VGFILFHENLRLKGVPVTGFTGVRLENTLRISSTISPDGQAVSVIFDNLVVAVGSTKGHPIATQVASIIVPMTENDAPLIVRQDIRGFVSIALGARAALIAHLGGKTFLVDLPTTPVSQGDYLRTFESTLPAGVDYQATFFLLVECDSNGPDVGAHLTVDALDITLKTQGSEKNKG